MSPNKPCVVEHCSPDARMNGPVEILAMIGAIVGILSALFFDLFPFLGFALGFSLGWLYGTLWSFIWGIVAIALCIALLAGLGIVKGSKFMVTASFAWMLVVGIIVAVPTGNIGGYIIVVAAILKLFFKKKT